MFSFNPSSFGILCGSFVTKVSGENKKSVVSYKRLDGLQLNSIVVKHKALIEVKRAFINCCEPHLFLGI